MKARRPSLAALAALAALATVASPALAAPSPISSIPTLARPTPPKGAAPAVAGLKITTKEMKNGQTWTDVDADTRHGYCIVDTEDGFSTSGSTGGMRDKSTIDVFRLSDKDGQATIEHARVTVDFATGDAKLVSRASTDLREVARSGDFAAWAYRQGGDVVVLARHVDAGVEGARAPGADGDTIGFVSVDECPWAGARLSLSSAKNGSVASLNGPVPKAKKARFVVDASMSRVTRDPEPMLSVRVRVGEDP